MKKLQLLVISTVLAFCFVATLKAAEDIQSQFENSWNYYSNRVQQGADDKERIAILDRMGAKYKDSNLDLSIVNSEKENLMEAQKSERVLEQQKKADFYYDYGKWKNEIVPNESRQVQHERLLAIESQYGGIPEAGEVIAAEKTKYADIDRTAPAGENGTWPAEESGRATEIVRQNDKRLFSPYIQLDLWTFDGAYSADADAWKGYFLNVKDEIDSADLGGVGVRLGLWRNYWESNMKLGLSIGYISGPTAKFSGTDFVYDPNWSAYVYSPVQTTNEMTVDYTRVLGELDREVPLGGNIYLCFRGGVGVAFGKITRELKNAAYYYYSPTRTFYFANGSSARGWSGVTWELSPALALKRNNTRFELGVAFAGLPAMSENDDWYEFKWNPVGIRFGMDF